MHQQVTGGSGFFKKSPDPTGLETLEPIEHSKAGAPRYLVYYIDVEHNQRDADISKKVKRIAEASGVLSKSLLSRIA
jgi:hypothetical protein